MSPPPKPIRTKHHCRPIPLEVEAPATSVPSEFSVETIKATTVLAWDGFQASAHAFHDDSETLSKAMRLLSKQELQSGKLLVLYAIRYSSIDRHISQIAFDLRFV